MPNSFDDVQPVEVLGIEHLDLTVSDLARSVDFYERILPVLGFRRLADDPDNVRWANARLTIGLRAAESGQRRTAFNRYRAGLHHVALKALSRADIDPTGQPRMWAACSLVLPSR